MWYTELNEEDTLELRERKECICGAEIEFVLSVRFPRPILKAICPRCKALCEYNIVKKEMIVDPYMPDEED